MEQYITYGDIIAVGIATTIFTIATAINFKNAKRRLTERSEKEISPSRIELITKDIDPIININGKPYHVIQNYQYHS